MTDTTHSTDPAIVERDKEITRLRQALHLIKADTFTTGTKAVLQERLLRIREYVRIAQTGGEA